MGDGGREVGLEVYSRSADRAHLAPSVATAFGEIPRCSSLAFAKEMAPQLCARARIAEARGTGRFLALFPAVFVPM